jgi:hypothetical protein
MRNIKTHFLGLLMCLLAFNCSKNENELNDCRGTTTWNPSSIYDNQVKSTVEYYNKSGYLTRIETSFFDSDNNYFETYKYDSENRIMEFFLSYEGYSKYYYNETHKVKIEYYDLDMNLLAYNTYEYLDNEIVNQHRYTPDGLDTTVNYYFNNGYLDSVVTMKIRHNLPMLYDKLEYKYDSKGNNIERVHYSNSETETIEIISRYLYSYDENSNVIKYELRDKEGNLKFGIYFRYIYNDIGNLIKTRIYDSNDNQIDSLLVDYQYCEEIKLIKPEL